MKKKPQQPEAKHEFAKLPEFDAAVRKMLKVSKEDIEQREREAKTPRTPREHHS